MVAGHCGPRACASPANFPAAARALDFLAAARPRACGQLFPKSWAPRFGLALGRASSRLALSSGPLPPRAPPSSSSSSLETPKLRPELALRGVLAQIRRPNDSFSFLCGFSIGLNHFHSAITENNPKRRQYRRAPVRPPIQLCRRRRTQTDDWPLVTVWPKAARSKPGGWSAGWLALS